MTRENAEEKGKRYLLEGRVTIAQALAERVVATVRSDAGAIYEVTHRRGGWACTCPARGRCAHLVAVGLITTPGWRLRLVEGVEGEVIDR